MGIGSIPMLINGELFPMNVKHAAASLNEIVSLAFNFAWIYFFNWIKIKYGLHVIYFICSCNCLLGILFTYFVVIETKGKSLDQIQLELK